MSLDHTKLEQLQNTLSRKQHHNSAINDELIFSHLKLTTRSISEILESAFSKKSSKKHIEILGLFQAIKIQQNCIKQLFKTFVNPKGFRNRGNWKTLIELNNLMTGKIVDNAFLSKIFFESSDLSHFDFEITDTGTNQTERHTLDLNQIIEGYTLEANKKIDVVISKLT